MKSMAGEGSEGSDSLGRSRDRDRAEVQSQVICNVAKVEVAQKTAQIRINAPRRLYSLQR